MVVNGNVTKAIRVLNTHVKEEKLIDKRRAAQVYLETFTSKSHQGEGNREKAKQAKLQDHDVLGMQAKARLVLVHAEFGSYLCTTALNLSQ